MKKAITILLALATSVALLALPAAASGEYFIPDGNSAVNQYTEGVPSGGGEKSTKGAGEKPVKPGEAIGAENTKKLEQAGGQEGREVAEVAAETAPPDIVAVEEEPAGGNQNGGNGHGGKAGKDAKGGGDGETDGEATAVVTPTSGDGPSGSGGVGEIVSAATGGSTGGIGLLLPLMIVAAIAWGIFYAWRKRDSDPLASNPR
ncbi:MAG: hypothetical protein QOE75_883 [Solirubrobacterales bacterium]|jgi:hypothetical protein|nr:hypothetical protein [Solirubrobacterales bacterium]